MSVKRIWILGGKKQCPATVESYKYLCNKRLKCNKIQCTALKSIKDKIYLIWSLEHSHFNNERF